MTEAVITFALAMQTVVAFSMHAPHEMDISSNKDRFWDAALGSIQKALQSHGVVWLFIDANARLGSTASDCFGPFGAEKENDNGGRLRRLLALTGMIALDTFADAGCT